MRAYHQLPQWIAECRPNDDLDILDIYTPLRPKTKERPRAEHHTPVKTRMWAKYLGIVTAEIMDGRPPINFPVSARVIFGLSGKRLADTDNLEKALWDGLQRGDASGKGRALQDDKWVRGFVEKGERIVAKGDEFLWVRFYAHNKEDADRYLEACNDVSDNAQSGYF